MSGQGGGSYNNAFERLVNESDLGVDDITGMVAYALYKREKREWALAIRQQHNRGPTADELQHWEATIGENRIAGLRQQAEGTAFEFANSVIADARPEIEKAAIRGKFVGNVGANLTASLVYTVILIIVAIILKIVGLDPLSIYQNLGPQPPG